MLVVPGRKTDVKDAEWICQLVEHGLVRASFVPPREIRELRDLVRYRKTQIEERTREVQRLEKTLQDAGIKLSSVASKVLGVSGRRDARSTDLRHPRSRGAGRTGQGQAALQDPRAPPSAGRPVHRQPRADRLADPRARRLPR